MFLETLTEYALWGSWLRAEITPTELEHFDRVIEQLQHGEDPDEELTDSAKTFQKPTGTPMQGLRNDQIQLNTVLDYLVYAHSTPKRQEVVRAALPVLRSLVVSHVHFPFSSPTSLTRDSICRGLLLLSNRGEHSFEHSEVIGLREVFSEHDHRKRLLFIYSSLAHAPVGKSAPTSFIRPITDPAIPQENQLTLT